MSTPLALNDPILQEYNLNSSLSVYEVWNKSGSSSLTPNVRSTITMCLHSWPFVLTKAGHVHAGTVIIDTRYSSELWSAVFLTEYILDFDVPSIEFNLKEYLRWSLTATYRLFFGIFYSILSAFLSSVLPRDTEKKKKNYVSVLGLLLFRQK